MSDIYYRDRLSLKIEKEKVYGQFFIRLLYGKGKSSRFFAPLLHAICRIPLFSKLYGSLQKTSLSRKKIPAFVKTYGIDTTEFIKPVEGFESFNDFFVRKLKPSARPVASGENRAVLPADGRYLAFSKFPEKEGIYAKNQCFSLNELLQDDDLAQKYVNGPMVTARLCPTDYHRFHFPCRCIPSKPRLINGFLYSVNPNALRKNINYITENKRFVTTLTTENFGKILFIEVGATYVGSVTQTYLPGRTCEKGGEKGFFSFGGSFLILLFEPGAIDLERDLLQSTLEGTETLGLFGQSLGVNLL